MHEEADFGLAAHWLYKELEPQQLEGLLLHERKSGHGFQKQQAETSRSSSDLQDDVEENTSKQNLIRRLGRLQKNLHSSTELLEPFQVNIFQNRIFVLTPTGQVKDLPNGSVPIDFAYAIHTDVGHRCYSAKVNNTIVPLDYQLKNGEVVEIITQKIPDPKPHWLSIVKTAFAKSKIKSYFKGFDTQKNFEHGKEILNKTLEHFGHEKLDENLSSLRKYAHQKLSLKDRRKIIEDVGNGSLQTTQVMKNIFGRHALPKELTSHADISLVPVKEVGHLKAPRIFIGGEANVPYKLSLCCKPVIGNPIVAYVGRGKAIRIHHESCKLLKKVELARTLEATWGSLQAMGKRFPVKITLEALDRVGLLRDIADAVASYHINILDISMQERVNNLIHRQMVLEVKTKEQLAELVRSLQQIRNVIKVEKVSKF